MEAKYLVSQLPELNAYPGPRSVLVMDNARIHHGDEIYELFDRHGDVSKVIIMIKAEL